MKTVFNTLNDSIQELVSKDTWEPEHNFSVFVQPDKAFYLQNEKGFIHKYKCLKSLLSVIKPESIIELGVLSGSGADAMLTGLDYKASYHGFDMWEETGIYIEDGVAKNWDRYGICKELFRVRKFTDYELTKTNLRDIYEIPKAEFVVVDAAHDYRNCYWDLRLAMTSKPKNIYVDDYVTPEIRLAVIDFAAEFKTDIAAVNEIEHINGGCLITFE
ncbi:MAG: hypothetical protein HOH16_00055 [Planctomycetaceae bacterium]|jgi:predicted O-methyltransferase YrrM|nr:hypothetical protein [Planctomycetaceae bacterium]